MHREQRTVAWIVACFVGLGLAVSVVTLLWVQNSGDDGAPTPAELSGGTSHGVYGGVVVFELTLLALFVGLAGYAAVRLFRQRGVKFEDLDPEEQARREDAGQLLHDH